MAVSWIQYKGKQILYADYRGLKTDSELLQNLKMEEKMYQESLGQILSLNDYRDTVISKSFMNEISKVGKNNKGKSLRSSILGVSGIKKILLNSYVKITGQSLRAFDDEFSAKEYLAGSN